ncbi:MAG: Formamidopyrimidine-DNA glycosylase [Parcubacteria group bacterium GW2011_GWC1_38_6]|nr:MAG: Formamidopyrimidine-DNA glycosylase [Parcubacteria group bacterium GW2011_GWC1_38_6]
MPELPEVETIVRDLNKSVLGRKIEDIWCDWKKSIKKPSNFFNFQKQIKKRRVKKIWRRAKNILIELSGDKILLIHQKMTGHLLYGKWQRAKGKWFSLTRGPIRDDPMNRFLHLIFWLDNGKQLALSDLRKFAKVELWDKNQFFSSPDFKSWGPEPLERNFTFEKFKKALPPKGRVKQVLMNPQVIAGIGNIYADEILWEAKVHPLTPIRQLNSRQLKAIYKAIRKVLQKAIKLGGTSISDFRKLSGEKGHFGELRRVYRRENEKCYRCGTIIKRIKIGGRGTCFCPACQKL